MRVNGGVKPAWTQRAAAQAVAATSRHLSVASRWSILPPDSDGHQPKVIGVHATARHKLRVVALQPDVEMVMLACSATAEPKLSSEDNE